MFKTPNRNIKSLQIQLVNSFIQAHDLTCHCNNPGFHTLLIAAKQIGPEITPSEKQQIQQCLGTTTTEEDAGEDPAIDFGDLDALFAEPGKEENTTGR